MSVPKNSRRRRRRRRRRPSRRLLFSPVQWLYMYISIGKEAAAKGGIETGAYSAGTKGVGGTPHGHLLSIL